MLRGILVSLLVLPWPAMVHAQPVLDPEAAPSELTVVEETRSAEIVIEVVVVAPLVVVAELRRRRASRHRKVGVS